MKRFTKHINKFILYAHTVDAAAANQQPQTDSHSNLNKRPQHFYATYIYINARAHGKKGAIKIYIFLSFECQRTRVQLQPSCSFIFLYRNV